MVTSPGRVTSGMTSQRVNEIEAPPLWKSAPLPCRWSQGRIANAHLYDAGILSSALQEGATPPTLPLRRTCTCAQNLLNLGPLLWHAAWLLANTGTIKPAGSRRNCSHTWAAGCQNSPGQPPCSRTGFVGWRPRASSVPGAFVCGHWRAVFSLGWLSCIGLGRIEEFRILSRRERPNGI